MNTHIGDKIFQDTLRRVAKFRENRPRDVEKSAVGKKDKTRPKYVFRYRWSDTRATVTRIVAIANASRVSDNSEAIQLLREIVFIKVLQQGNLEGHSRSSYKIDHRYSISHTSLPIADM